MCTNITTARKVISTQYALAKFLGVSVRRLPTDNRYDERSLVGAACLCPIAVEAALDDAGIHWECYNGDPMDIRIK